MRNGEDIPERIANAPELWEGSYLYLDSFFDLDRERSHGAGLTPIPWSSISDYADAYGFTFEEKQDLIDVIKAMDSAHLERLGKKLKDAMPKPKGK